MMKFHHRLMLLISTILIISFITLGLILQFSIGSLINHKQQQSLTQDAQTYIYLSQQHKDHQLEKIAKQQHIDIRIIKNNKDIFKTQAINFNSSNDTNYIHNGKTYTFMKEIDKYQVIIKGVNYDISDMQKHLWLYLTIICLVVLICLYFVSQSFKHTFIKPIQEVTYATQLLADGHYHIRVPESNVIETKELFITTNNLARQLQKLNNEQKIQSNRLKTTIENIPSSVLMIDRNGRVVVANRAYYEQFNINHHIEHERYSNYLHHDIEELILECFKVEKAIYEQLEIPLNNVHSKYFDISCVPILTKSKKSLQGILLVMHDISNLKRLENLRREFVANVSHELKTPITSIKGFTETLIDGAKNDSESLDMFLNIILKESNRIESLISDLLDLSYIEQQDKLEMDYMNLSELTFRIIDNLQTQAMNKHIEIVTAITEDVIIQAQESKIAQVITNLLNNAINYSYDNGKVNVKVYRNQTTAVLEIQDFGIGINEEDIQHIFERFYRVDKARSRDSGGTGLGLSITKHIVESHHASIEVQSEIGKGSIFKVIFNDYIS
ncbi:PAS domain-containing protein [Staphylococcus simiae]|uniref:two-component system histidine kinase PnpS n=1 Tax=Staphylococcus simiae TaxID=308354 RepID=UPI001A971545|nr:ATP-binding protein [Staphylococcus simiae]MBO1198490.1 PAS domain-containing protein [Staphylococcus simiae]MBO1201584.1 PAS domain-containing protein [Staphylococcus simiae]MBO1204247.1 PAS domain-containing protein [Staphylococcus simiae]MBO1210481.1 PAS domain-containing protein [Staphylococcus simiae]MBO1229965.1 PAS domain-containing protein [Staphylococcus simiae]